jgi:hypothetical protein
MKKITIEELLRLRYCLTKNGRLTTLERNGNIFEFGDSNIPVLRERISDTQTEYIGGFEHFEKLPLNTLIHLH